jgi:DNA-nicking Smr family endonuclease
MRDISM